MFQTAISYTTCIPKLENLADRRLHCPLIATEKDSPPKHPGISTELKNMDERKLTLLDLFLGYVKYEPNGRVDASGILSKECFEGWLITRETEPIYAPRRFKDAIKGVLSGRKRCRPFPPAVETDLLKHLRQPRVWPCFKDLDNVNIGYKGFETLGYHEKLIQSYATKVFKDPSIATISPSGIPRDIQGNGTVVKPKGLSHKRTSDVPLEEAVSRMTKKSSYSRNNDASYSPVTTDEMQVFGSRFYSIESPTNRRDPAGTEVNICGIDSQILDLLIF